MAPNRKKIRKGPQQAGRRAPGAKKQLQKQEETVVCSDIESLSLAKFLKCMVDNNLSVLRISGNPSAHQLFMAWITILSAYYTLINSKEQLKYIRMVGKMEGLNLKITIVKALCEAVRAWYDERLCNCLKGWGYKLSYSPETLLQDTERTLTELSNDEYKLIRMKTEYKQEQKNKKKKGEAPTKNSFMKMLYAIEKHRKISYDPDDITVYKFGMLYNELVEYSEMVKAQTDELTVNKYRKNGK